ncbi:hypothetical protein H0H92_002917 [Tricholoma furcatifolium]|nr:hypothetical protein H0H92_002917 [Tricholoma furcatifolium]
MLLQWLLILPMFSGDISLSSGARDSGHTLRDVDMHGRRRDLVSPCSTVPLGRQKEGLFAGTRKPSTADPIRYHNHLTCKGLYGFSITRPVYRQIANDLLRRSRALPLKGFQRITDLTTPQLIRAVNKATRYEYAWQRRGPRPISVGPYTDINEHSNYMDVPKGVYVDGNKWYKVVSSPPEEDVDWLSPITSSYTLCATKTGKVVCWDVQTDKCLAQWSPGERWELWKCRVEFDEKTVYFTMAKVVVSRNDDTRLMEFVLMRLRFFDGSTGESSERLPMFEHVTNFKTKGVVMNVFLLDPIARLLSAFVYSNTTYTICLYALLDWDKPEYIFIDTGIECVPSSNWSCILFERNIVIHCEESHGAYQYFYPLHLLEMYTKTLSSPTDVPKISYRVSPAKTLHRKFVFPQVTNTSVTSDAQPDETTAAPTSSGATTMNGVTTLHSSSPQTPSTIADDNEDSTPSSSISTLSPTSIATPSPTSTPSGATISTPTPTPSPTTSTPNPPNPNPYPFPPWCPDSAHFVRQWWPTLPGIPRVSCTVVLLAAHDPVTHRTKFMLAQHYFRVPLTRGEWDPNVVTELTHKLVGERHSLRPAGEPLGSGGAEVAKTDVNGGGTSPTASTSTNDEIVDSSEDEVDDAALMHLWYVDTPFEVVCVAEAGEDAEGDDDGESDRPRPLVAVDFGHAAWIEFVDNEDDPTRPRVDDVDAKWLRFVTFPPFDDRLGKMPKEGEKPWSQTGGVVRTLETPPELDLDLVETINIDQSQGAVILSVRDGMIFILCYR